MRRISFAMMLIWAFQTLVAQPISIENGVDRFTSYEAIENQEVCIYKLSELRQNDKKFYIYSFNGKKMSPIKDIEIYKSIEAKRVIAGGIKVIKDKKYLEIKTANQSVFLLVNSNINFLDCIRSMTYWDNYLSMLRIDKFAIDKDDDPGLLKPVYYSLQNNGYNFFEWKDFIQPAQMTDPIYINCKVNGYDNQLLYSTLQSHIDHFISKEEYETRERIRKEKIRMQQIEDSIKDSQFIFEATVKRNALSDAKMHYAGVTLYNDLDYTCSIYGFDGSDENGEDFFLGYVVGYKISLPKSVLITTDDDNFEYLKRRGTEGNEIREDNAFRNDIKHWDPYMKRLEKETEELLARVKEIDDFYRKQKILIISQTYSYSDYQFGLKFNFRNSYSDEIKYIEVKIVAYNAVGDPQRDDLGNSSKEVRCIGPIEMNELATYDFDKLFWDDRDVISKLQVERVKVTLMNGSVITYNGKKEVDKHRLSNYPDIVKKIESLSEK